MSAEKYYLLCNNAIGGVVEIETADGSIYQSIIEDVDHNYLYLRSIHSLAELLISHHKDTKNELNDSVLAIPLASIIALTFIPLTYL